MEKMVSERWVQQDYKSPSQVGDCPNEFQKWREI